MDSNGSSRRRFLKHAGGTLAGVAAGAGAGAEWARGQTTGKGEGKEDHAAHVSGEHLRRGVPPRRGVRMSVDHITFYTPLQDYGGVITTAPPPLFSQTPPPFPRDEHKR